MPYADHKAGFGRRTSGIAAKHDWLSQATQRAYFSNSLPFHDLVARSISPSVAIMRPSEI